MALIDIKTLSASGTSLLVAAAQGAGPDGWTLVFKGSGWTGSVVLKVNTAPQGAAVSYLSIPYLNANTGATINADTPITTDGTFIVSETYSNYDLYAVYTHTAGSVAIPILTESRGGGTGPGTGTTAADVDGSAGQNVFGANVPYTGGYTFPSSLTVTTALSAATMAFTTSLTSAAGKIAMGASPLSSADGAIHIDAQTYTAIAMKVVNAETVTPVTFVVDVPNNATILMNTSEHPLLLGTGGVGRLTINGASAGTAITEVASSQATFRLIGGSTNGVAIRDSNGVRDNFRVFNSGSQATLYDGTRTLDLQVLAAQGEGTSGAYLQANTVGHDGVWLAGRASGTTSKVGALYYNGTQLTSAWEVVNVSSGFGTLALMKSGGNAVIGGTAAGATANGTLAFSVQGTSPSATVDLVHLYGLDISAGNRSLAIYQECPVNAAAAVASTHRLPVTINGTQYAILLTTTIS